MNQNIVPVLIILTVMTIFGLVLWFAVRSDNSRAEHNIKKLNTLCQPHQGVAELKLFNNGRSGGAAVCKDGTVVVR